MHDLTPFQTIGSEFKALPNEPSGEWEFAYKNADQILSLRVKLHDQSLVSELDKASVDELILWLQRARHTMPD